MMNSPKIPILLLVFITLLVVSACQPGAQSQGSHLDKLAQVQEKGTLVVSIDPAYPPQSEIKPGAARSPDTDCKADQLTAGELVGFNVQVAVELATRLGVEACFVSPPWTEVIQDNWKDRWDVNVNSMAITPERMNSAFKGFSPC